MDIKMSLNKVIIWGYPINTHTHSYIHYAWNKTFKYLGYDTHWFDDTNFPSPETFEYKNCLFITEGYAESNIPLDSSNTYFIHVCINPGKYIKCGARVIDIRYNVSNINDYNYSYNLDDKISNNIAKMIPNSTINYYEENASVEGLNAKFQSEENRLFQYEAIYMCWATDLLPHEINFEDRFIQPEMPPRMFFIGSVGSGNMKEMIALRQGCIDNNIECCIINPWTTPVTFEEAQKLVQKSYIAPDVRGSGEDAKKQQNETGTDHKGIGYIPCRLFKNISYGKVGGVNAHRLQKLFGSNILYDSNETELVKKCIENRTNYNYILQQMEWVAKEHTYINRVNDLLTVLGYKEQILI